MQSLMIFHPFFQSTVVMVKGRLVGIIGYVTRSTEYNFPLHEVILALKGNRDFTFVSPSFYMAGVSIYHFNLWYIHVYNEMENYFFWSR